MTAQGPFRRDARVEMTSRTLAMREQWRAVKRARGLGLEMPGYVAALGLVTTVTAAYLGGEARLAIVGGVAMLALAVWLAKRYRAAFALHADTPPRTVALHEDGLDIDAGERRTFWRWSAVHGVRVIAHAIVIELEWGQAIALEPSARTAEWLVARVGESSRVPRGRVLLLLAALYAMIALAVVVVLPDVIGAP